jgi:DNA-binding transcriptional ArsR family regulator
MVNLQPSAQDYDRLFFALSNGARRGMTEILMREGPKPMSELARPFGISLPGAMKHIGVLEEAGIVTCRRLGRENICSVNAAALHSASRWFEFHSKFWNASLDRLGHTLERGKK